MHVLKTAFHSNSNLGLYGFATDSYCLLPKNLKSHLIAEIKEVLKVPIYQVTLHNTHLIGIFCNGNESYLFVPSIIPAFELKELKKIKEAKLIVLDTKLTALGNNLLISKNKCFFNPNLESSVLEQLKKLGFELKPLEIADNITPGSCAVVNAQGCLIHRDATNLKVIQNFFKLKTDIGTVNFGNPYVKSGLILNSYGYIIGRDTTGPEIQRIDETLGFI